MLASKKKKGRSIQNSKLSELITLKKYKCLTSSFVPSTRISSSTAGCWTRTDLEVALSHTMVNFLNFHPSMYQFLFEGVHFSVWNGHSDSC